jgi:hypothetical protein
METTIDFFTVLLKEMPFSEEFFFRSVPYIKNDPEINKTLYRLPDVALDFYCHTVYPDTVSLPDCPVDSSLSVSLFLSIYLSSAPPSPAA